MSEQPQKIPVNPNTWIILGCVLLLVASMSIAMFYMVRHVNELKASPFLYGAQKISEKYNDAEVTCSCLMRNAPSYVDPKFYFNNSNFWTDETASNTLNIGNTSINLNG